MVSDRDNLVERRARVDAMQAEFRAARQRTLVKRGIPAKDRAEVAPDVSPEPHSPPEKLK